MKINCNIYLKELHLNKNSFLSWSIAVALVIFFSMSFYPVLVKDDILNQMTALFENPFMKTIMSAFGASLEAMTNSLGFYSTRNAMYLMMPGGFFSFLLGGRIVAREEGEKSGEFLLTKPVTRTEIMISKLAAFLTYLIAFTTVVATVGLISLELFKAGTEYSLAAFFIHTFYTFLLILIFGAIGLYLSMWVKRGRSIASLSVGIIVGTFFIDAMSKVTPSLDLIGYLSPYKFVDSGVLRPDYAVQGWRVLYFLGVSIVLIVLSVIKFRKKDILI